MKKITLGERWVTFLKIIFDPWILFLLLLIIILLYDPFNFINEDIEKFIVIIISILAGLVGGLVTKRWTDYNEEKLIQARGISAIRSLKVLLLNIDLVEKRVRKFLDRLDPEEKDFDLNRTRFEEIGEMCKILEEESVNAIENWNDIIPEANISTQIGIVSDLKRQSEVLKFQIAEKNLKLDELKEASDKDREDLNKQIDEMKKKYEEVRQNLREKEMEINDTILSGTSSLDLSASLASSLDSVSIEDLDQLDVLSWLRYCKVCRKPFASFGRTSQDVCKECKSKSKAEDK